MKKGQRETQGVGYKSFTPHWSRTIHVVEKKVRGKYKISGISYTLFPDELQKVIDKPEPLTSEDKEEQAALEPEGAVAKMRAQRKADRQPRSPSPPPPRPSASPPRPSASPPRPSVPPQRPSAPPPRPTLAAMRPPPQRRVPRRRRGAMRMLGSNRQPAGPQKIINRRPETAQQRQINTIRSKRDALARLRARQANEREQRALRRQRNSART